jgi:hypothetical protein
MNDIEKILGEMEAYVEMHAKGWGSKDAAKDHLSQHALCYSATQYPPPHRGGAGTRGHCAGWGPQGREPIVSLMRSAV